MIKRTLIQIRYALQESKRASEIHRNKEYELNRLSASIIRLVHSIEKGLSIESPRLGFGYLKIEKLATLVEEYMKESPYDMVCIYMANSALKGYCDYHDSKGYKSQKYTRVKELYDIIQGHCRYAGKIEGYGGIKKVSLNELNYDINDIEQLFRTRHSIREFDKKPVDVEKIKKAVALAQRAPSACNRQAVRVYAIDSNKYAQDIGTSLEGVGGFTDDVDQFLIITGKLSAYDEFEYNQFIVSAGILVGYLSLALHAYQIGACIIQRSLRVTEQWTQFCTKYNIPGDEQIVCMIGIGNMKESTTVPISHRYSLEEIFRELT